MRWPWSRRNESGPPVSDDVDEAVDARRCAEEALERTKGQSEEISAVAERARLHRRVNHFAELIGETFRGGRA